MEKRKREMKLNIPMCAACILLCLTLISIHMTGGLYAKYTSDAQGSDSARVAKYTGVTIEESGDFGTNGGSAVFVPGVDLKKDAEVSFDASEVSVYVFVEAILSGQWENVDSDAYKFALKSAAPDEDELLRWEIADGWTHVESNDGTHVYYREVKYGTKLDGENIIANDGAIKVNEDITKSQIATMYGEDIFVKFRGTAVQSGDSGTAEEAWNLLK